MKKLKNLLTSITVGALLIGSAPVMAAPDDSAPGAGAMAADLVVARPLGMVITVAGAVAFVVSLPFSALGGNIEEAADALVMGPGRTTFIRCLGCRTNGKYQSSKD